MFENFICRGSPKSRIRSEEFNVRHHETASHKPPLIDRHKVTSRPNMTFVSGQSCFGWEGRKMQCRPQRRQSAQS